MSTQPGPKEKQVGKSTYILLIIGVVLCVICFVVPPPAGFSEKGWKVLGLLIPVIMVWATEAMPVGVGSVWFLALVSAFGLVKPDVAFSGFLEHLTWLMAGAFAIATAMQKTGLSKRMTYFLLSKAKGFWTIIGAGYLANVLMLAIPSSAARSGILAPIVNAIMDTVGRPSKSNFSRLITYHFCMATNAFVGIMFLTGGAANPVMLGLYSQASGSTVTWNQWLMIMFIPVLAFTAIMVAGSVLVGGRPEPELIAMVRNSEATKKSYEELGPITSGEKKVMAAFVLAVVLWALGDTIGVRPGYSALIVMGLLFLPGVGVLPAKALKELNWNIILLIGAVMGLGSILTETGLNEVLSNLIFAPIMNPLSHLGLIGVALGVIAISLVAHFILPSPNNLTLVVPLLVTWGINANLHPAALLAFLGMLALINDKVILLSYQMPPYYVYLGMDVTDIPRFNQLLLRMYPVAMVAMIVAAFLIYSMIMLTGAGI